LIGGLKNIQKIPELQKRIAFTFLMLAVYRVGAHVPTPGIDTAALAAFFDQAKGSLLGLFDLFAGGALSNLSVFALGIMPYISASIILQLLTIAIPHLERLSKEGEAGRRKITQYTRYGTVVLSLIQGFGIAVGLENMAGPSGASIVITTGWGFRMMTVITLTAGTAFIMWLGEQITDRGIGNGMSLLIFAGIIAGLPRGVMDLIQKVQTNQWGSFTIVAMLGLVAFMFAVVAFIVYVERSERRIPIQSARRIVGRRMMGGQSSHLPLKVNSGGVMPVIFAASILSAPLMLSQAEFVQNSKFLQPIVQALQPGYPWYEALYVLAIIFFAYFYVSIIMKPDDIADNFRKSGSFIPGIRPGKRTSDFINDILTRITLVGAMYLIIISLVPTFLISGLRFDKLWLIGSFFERMPNWITHGLNVNFYFGGTSLLIVVGVAMDTINQIESQLIMRHYDGFSPRSGRIRGRKTW
jgi:preprotein translocase subunit SecY